MSGSLRKRLNCCTAAKRRSGPKGDIHANAVALHSGPVAALDCHQRPHERLFAHKTNWWRTAGHAAFLSVGRKLPFSGACRFTDTEAVLQHLEARYEAAGDCQDDRKLRGGDFPSPLDSRLQCPDDRCAAVASEDVIDFKGNGLCQRADITDEIDDRPAASLAADPRKNAVIALDLEYDFSVEQGGNLGRTPVTADRLQQFLCDSDVMLMIHHLLDASDMRSPYPRSNLRLAAKRSRHETGFKRVINFSN
jgi:hypothetical protein